MIAATYFDGRTAQAHQVRLSFDGDDVVVSGPGVERRSPIAAVVFDEELGSTPRIVRFVDGGICEVPNHRAFAAVATAHGVRLGPVATSERNWRVATASAAALLTMAIVFYTAVLPALAWSAARALPSNAVEGLSRRTLATLDQTVLAKSRIDGRRRASLMNATDRLSFPAGERPAISLEFRRSDTLGANAFALPSGTIVLTDAFVDLVQDDREILAVIAHEAGHVARRHGLRKVIQASTIAILVTWYVGDVSAIVAGAPTVLLQAKYSRDLEREADAYAAEVLVRSGLSPGVLAAALERLEAASGSTSTFDGYVSSHPATAERLAWLRSR